jgi:3-oxoacyl-[acyl-carrier-protein] synthase II
MSAATAAVVVTGIGAVVGLCSGVGPLADALRAGVLPSSEVDRSAGYHLPESSRLAVLTDGVDLSSWVTPAAGRRMSPPSKLGVAAARMALEDAGPEPPPNGATTAVVISIAFPAVQATEGLLRTVFEQGPESASPFLFTESVANAPAAQIAIAVQAKGPNLTIVQGEAGALTAVGRGMAEVAAGRADRALVGSIQEMPPLLHALLDRFGALARPNGDGGEVARPFDRRRAGFIAAEGAVVLVLEPEDRARERGATLHARIRGFGGAFDASAPRVGWGSGHQRLGRGLERMLARAGVETGRIGRIVSGASGSIGGDRLEARTLRQVWKDTSPPPILAPKRVVGEYGGGFLAAALLAAGGDDFGGPACEIEADPELGLTPHPGGPLPAAELTLVTSLASGGAASGLLVERL